MSKKSSFVIPLLALGTAWLFSAKASASDGTVNQMHVIPGQKQSDLFPSRPQPQPMFPQVPSTPAVPISPGVSKTISGPYTLAGSMPTLPPGTTPEVEAAVEASFNAGTLTERQAEAVSQLYAPMYFSDSVNGYATTEFGTAAAAQAALDAYMKNFV